VPAVGLDGQLGDGVLGVAATPPTETDPEIAHVGRTEAEARASGDTCEPSSSAIPSALYDYVLTTVPASQ
jgi:hypothetical protein